MTPPVQPLRHLRPPVVEDERRIVIYRQRKMPANSTEEPAPVPISLPRVTMHVRFIEDARSSVGKTC